MLSKLLGVRIFDVEASSRCDVRCRFCPREHLPETGLMTQKTFDRFLDAVPLRPTDTVSFVGLGEPTLNPLLPGFVRQTKTRHPKTMTWVTSNGAHLGGKRVRPLIEAGLDILDISFNGLDANSYETNMRGACFETTLANVERIVAMIERTGAETQLQINYVIGPDNAEDAETIERFWRARGIRRFRPQALHDRAGLVRTAAMLSARGLNGKPCELFEVISFVSWRGDVLPCCHDVRRACLLGNVNTDSWSAIAARKRAMRRNKAWPSFCGACTDPLRFSLRRQIDRAFRAEMLDRLAQRLPRFGGQTAQPGWRTAKQVGR